MLQNSNVFFMWFASFFLLQKETPENTTSGHFFLKPFREVSGASRCFFPRCFFPRCFFALFFLGGGAGSQLLPLPPGGGGFGQFHG